MEYIAALGQYGIYCPGPRYIARVQILSEGTGGFQRRKFQTRTRFFSLPPLPTTHYVILHHYNDIHNQRLIIHGVNYIHAIPHTEYSCIDRGYANDG